MNPDRFDLSRLAQAADSSDEAGRVFLEALERRDHICRLFEGLLESAADGVAALDFQGEVVYLSESLRGRRPEQQGKRIQNSLTGGRGSCSPEAGYVGRPVRGAGDFPEEVLSALRRNSDKVAPGRTYRFQLEWPQNGSGRRFFEVTASAGIIPTGNGAADRAVTLFTFRDRTREQDLEVQAAQSRELASVGQMAATIAHELRNPLGAVQGFAALLQQDLEGQERPLHLVEKILEGVDRANAVITDMLEFARPVEIRPAPLDLGYILEESLTVLRLSPRYGTGIDLDVHLDPDLPLCLGDRRLLLQVLANLYQNAAEAMEGRGTLSLRVRAADGSGDSERIRMVIRDTGCGMTAEQVGRVFEPFFSTKPSGTGLGLALVRKIVEAHGGRIHLVSAPGRGTSVVLDLPGCGRLEEEPVPDVVAGERCGAEAA